ncbi:hypothetical protein IEQ34_008954 [Dendrobium chrysotoxum]|uniref:Cytosol aminopeptidase domain-containing protein n=1 Tax=Dendrobium chrysotoxum TaxID=161865 RepID=A0AAV7H022_DENCH|nr:hypothetical protein IEQ34_008954 [Dendrobium chrysotoxum]
MAQRARGRDRGKGGRGQDGWRMRAAKTSSPPPTPGRPITHVGSGSNSKAESNVMGSSTKAASKWVITEKPIWNIKENISCDEDNSQKEEVSNFTKYEKLNEFVKTLTSLSESHVDDLNVALSKRGYIAPGLIFQNKIKYAGNISLHSPVSSSPLRARALSFSLIELSIIGRMASGAAGRATLGLTKPAAIEVPQVSFSAKEIDFAEWKGDLLAIAVSESDMSKDEDLKFLNSILKRLDGQLNGLLSDASIEEDFKGKNGQSIILRLPGFGFRRLGLVGLSQSATSVAATHRDIGEAIAAVAKAAQASSAAIILASTNGISEEFKLTAASAISIGIVLGLHEDNRYKSESKKPYLKSVDIIGLGFGPELDNKLKYSNAVSSGIIFARELVNSPANVLTPAVLAEEASKVASVYNDVFTAKVLDVEQCMELKMGSYLGVAAASSNPPHFIHLCYRPPSGDVKTKLAIVGKGLTFDSGGYNIKTGPACSIDLMKFDMGGSAAAFGAAKVHFIVAACENMISGTGMRPGDIVTASNGKTIEVNNTDAEGRLTLADALVYACDQGVEKIVDLATLTGACIVALGSSIAGIFTPSDELAKEITAAALLTGEKFWRLPLEDSYWESMKSSVADMVNSGGRQGGAILAALFLKQFVNEKVQWMHIDVAGPVWNDKKRTATGFGVSTLVEWVLKNSS